MGIRSLPFFKGKKGWQFAGGGQDDGGGGGSYTLPVATNSRLGGVKVGSGLEITNDGTLSASGGSGGGASYSTSKFDTGKKWIDGRTIWGIVFTDNSTSTGKQYTMPTNVDKILSIVGCLYRNSSDISRNNLAYPFGYYAGGTDRCSCYGDYGKIDIEFSMNFDDPACNIIVEYVETN